MEMSNWARPAFLGPLGPIRTLSYVRLSVLAKNVQPYNSSRIRSIILSGDDNVAHKDKYKYKDKHIHATLILSVGFKVSLYSIPNGPNPGKFLSTSAIDCFSQRVQTGKQVHRRCLSQKPVAPEHLSDPIIIILILTIMMFLPGNRQSQRRCRDFAPQIRRKPRQVR